MRALLTKIDSVRDSKRTPTYAKPTPDAEDIRQLASISLPMAGLIVLTALIALARPHFR